MAGMVADPGDLRDDIRHARQRPELGAEAMGPRADAQRALDRGQLLGRQLRFAAQSPRAFEPLPPLGAPRVEPVVRAHARDAQRLCHCRL
jgi:hypothetical protein